MAQRENNRVCVYTGEELARYSFGQDHPFGPGRHAAFVEELMRQGLDRQVRLLSPALTEQVSIERFHTHAYVEQVKEQSQSGCGYLDQGDTPAFPGVYEAACTVVGTVLDALENIIVNQCCRVFIPIAGLHHARRDQAAGFCVFNDCGVAIETLRQQHGIRKIAYIDIDAHHGDGVFYAYEDDPDLFIVDFHEDGRTLYPGTGSATETGRGSAQGTKLNIPMPAGATDDLFIQYWPQAEEFLHQAKPEFILFQCGADSIDGDPITHMAYSPEAHRYATEKLCKIADTYASGRILALGGGGYNLNNLAQGWCAVVAQMISD